MTIASLRYRRLLKLSLLIEDKYTELAVRTLHQTFVDQKVG